jgi:uncharacterized protein (TIGR02646 family)
MKQINKGETPEFFSEFVKKEKPQEWDDIKPIRQMLRQHILTEQNSCCAYTEVFIKDSNKKNCHIDHYKKQAFCTTEEKFDYNNLLVSTNAEEYGAKYKDKHITLADYNDLINPIGENPMDYLEFTYAGQVIAKNKSKKGENTIKLFNLNERNLVNRRVVRLKQLIEYEQNFSLEEVIGFFNGEFASMISQLYNGN